MLLIQPDLLSWAVLQSFKTSTYQIYFLRGKFKSFLFKYDKCFKSST